MAAVWTSATLAILEDSPDPTVPGQPYLVRVRAVSTGPFTPNGVVVLSDARGASCTASLSPVATAFSAEGGCMLSSNGAAGALTLTATYETFRAAFATSTGLSPTATTEHSLVRGELGLSSCSDEPDPSTLGSRLLVEFNAAPGATGVVTVGDGASTCTATLPNRRCSLPLNTLGARTLSFSYPGDAGTNAATASDSHTVVACPGNDLAVRLYNNRRTLSQAGKIEYTLHVSYCGTSTVTGARVELPLPASLSNAQWLCTASSGASCTASGVGAIDQLVTLAPGSDLLYTFAATVSGTEPASANLSALLSGPLGFADGNTANNSARDDNPIGLFGAGYECGLD